MTQEATMRGLVLMESLIGGQLPMPLQAVVLRRYPHLLGGELPVQIAELMVPRDRALAMAMQLAQALLPRRFYAHLLNEDTMYQVFPNCVTAVRRGDDASAEAARAIGRLYEIPVKQMRFGEMFDHDHPDSPATTEEAVA